MSDYPEVSSQLSKRNMWWYAGHKKVDYIHADTSSSLQMAYIGSPSSNEEFNLNADANDISLTISVPGDFKQARRAYAESALPEMPDMSGSSMWIPWSDFKEILEKLLDAQRGLPDEPPPYDAVVSSADYVANVGEDNVSVKISAKIFVLKQKGWASAPVIKYGLPISNATLDGKSTALVSQNDDCSTLCSKVLACMS